jgi:hypothetical protein
MAPGGLVGPGGAGGGPVGSVGCAGPPAGDHPAGQRQQHRDRRGRLLGAGRHQRRRPLRRVLVVCLQPGSGDTNGTTDVFVHDRQTATTERVSVDSRERQSTGGDQGGTFDTNFGRPALSPDGRLVAFTSDADNLAT